MNGNQLREGIFSLYTRRFGRVAELMIKRLLSLEEGRNIFHDLYDDTLKHRVEVKFSVVRSKSETKLNEGTVLQCNKEAVSENRMITFAGWENAVFDCNIQQIKKTEFEILYYGLFFYDTVVIFRINSEEIGPNINYSDKQHKGNIGEGQFHINQKTLQIHLDYYRYKTISYEELAQILGR